ncbi:MAG: Wzz/FepE/Etk N-terminal domain-containing protein, partial [Aquihabitans sp.]
MPPSYNQATANLELRDYMSILRRRRVLIALIAGAVVVVSLAYSLTRTPVYEAQAQVIIQNRESDQILGSSVGADSDAIRREILLMGSNQYVQAIQQRLGYLPEPKLVANAQVTPGVRITISNPNAARSAKEATDFAEAYVAERRKAITADLAASIAEIKTQMGSLPIELAAARERISALTLEINASTDPAQIAVKQAQIDQLMAQVAPAAADGRMGLLQGQLDRLTTAQASNAGKGRFVVGAARVPAQPVYPTPARNAVLALFGGLVLGLAAAFIRDYFDDTLRTKEDLDNASGGITVLGIIPAIDGWRDRGTALLESVSHPNSAASEAYRGLRTSIEFLAVDEKLRIIHVTSSTSGEGKSTTSANLAVT